MATLTLDWIKDLEFKSGPGGAPIELASSTPGVLSPVTALGYATMACMAMDVAHVLTKGRHDLVAMRVSFEADRANEPPRRYTAIRLHFAITGTVDPHVVERAINLSKTKYCSVMNSLRTDIDVKTDFTITPKA